LEIIFLAKLWVFYIYVSLARVMNQIGGIIVASIYIYMYIHLYIYMYTHIIYIYIMGIIRIIGRFIAEKTIESIVAY
jgi:hypothetical protein